MEYDKEIKFRNTERCKKKRMKPRKFIMKTYVNEKLVILLKKKENSTNPQTLKIFIETFCIFLIENIQILLFDVFSISVTFTSCRYSKVSKRIKFLTLLHFPSIYFRNFLRAMKFPEQFHRRKLNHRDHSLNRQFL